MCSQAPSWSRGLPKPSQFQHWHLYLHCKAERSINPGLMLAFPAQLDHLLSMHPWICYLTSFPNM